MTFPRRAVRARLLLLLAVLLAMVLGGCSSPGGEPPAQVDAGATASVTHAAPDRPKVLLLIEENTDPEEVVGVADAPYLNDTMARGATVPDMDAGYPARCPSLPAYLLLTSGSTHQVCDDRGPAAHQVDGPSIFSRTVRAGQQWRVFAESMDQPCRRSDTPDGRYLVRHTAAPYYTTEVGRCDRWQLPMGTPESGALATSLADGLPAFSLVVPDRCDDMHGGSPCSGDRVAEADRWLQEWLPSILGGPDYASGRLLVIITWDEAQSAKDNQIPTIVLHPGLAGTEIEGRRTHCSTLRTMTDWLGLDPLGCAADAVPLVRAEPGSR